MFETNSKEAKTDNLEALKKRETVDGEWAPDMKGLYPKRWAGTIEKNWGEWIQNGYNSGEWGVEIKSESLTETVFARVNEDRKEGAQVQFYLLPQVATAPEFLLPDRTVPEGRMTESPMFEYHCGQKSLAWRIGMFPDESATVSAVDSPGTDESTT